MPRHINTYPWVKLDITEAFIPLMRESGAAKVARSHRGFYTAYKKANGQPGRMGRTHPDTPNRGDSYMWWQRRNEFIARHMGQVNKNNEALWDRNGNPTKRHQGLLAWAYTPDPDGVLAWAQQSSARSNPAQSDVGIYQDILAHLRGLQWVYWTTHWTSKGGNFYGDHLLLERLYTKGIVDQIDALGERMVFNFGPASVAPAQIQHKANILVHRAMRGEDPLKGLYRLESTLQSEIAKAWKANQASGSEMSLGLDAYLTDLANERDTARYLLKQRME